MRTIILLFTMSALIWGQHGHVGLPRCPTRGIGARGATTEVMPCSLHFSIPASNLQFAQGYPNLLVTSASPSSLIVSASTVSGGPWLHVGMPQATHGITGFPGYYAFIYVSFGLEVQALAAGTYAGAVTITLGSDRPLTVPVTLTVGGPPILSVAPASINVSLPNTGQTSSTVFSLVDAGGSYPPGLMATTATSNGLPWLTEYVMDLTPGASPGVFIRVAHIDALGLTPGLHRGTITYASGSNVQAIPVTLWVHGELAVGSHGETGNPR